MLRRVILLLALSLNACATPVWNKPGASESDLAVDKFACFSQSQRRVTGGNAAPDQLVTDPERFRACMQDRGWSPSR